MSSAIARATKPTAPRDLTSSAGHGIDEVMKAQTLDALLFPARAAPPSRPSRAIRPSSSRSARSRTRRRRRCRKGSTRGPAPYGVSFTGHGVQRAAPDRAGVCVRAGHAPARAAAVGAVNGDRLDRRLRVLRPGPLVDAHSQCDRARAGLGGWRDRARCRRSSCPRSSRHRLQRVSRRHCRRRVSTFRGSTRTRKSSSSTSRPDC